MLMNACDAAPPTDVNAGFVQLRLPKQLTEISGLVHLQQSALLTMGDERAQVYEVDFSTQKVKRRMSLGSPAVKGDFEGIAILADQLYLVTSDGDLYHRALSEPDTNSTYTRIKTKLGRACEIEGLAADTNRERLLILCKTPRKKRLKNHLTVYSWNPLAGLEDDETISINLKQAELGKLNPSALAFLPGYSDRLRILASKQGAFVDITLGGEVLEHGALATHHNQPEGLAFDAEGRIYISDEGGRDRGTITRYDRPF